MRPPYFMLSLLTIAIAASGCSGGSKNDSGPIPVVSASPSTSSPSSSPTSISTTAPTTAPTTIATTVPTTGPNGNPTTAPTTIPTTAPTTKPTTAPSSSPTASSSAPPSGGNTSGAAYVDNGEVCTAGSLEFASSSGYPSTFYCTNQDYPKSSQASFPGVNASNGDVYQMQTLLSVDGDTGLTGNNPTANASFFFGNPNAATYPVVGTAVVSVQFKLVDTPSPYTLNNDWQLGFSLTSNNTPVTSISPNAAFACTIYDNTTQLGTGTSSIQYPDTNELACTFSPRGQNPMDGQNDVAISTTGLNIGDTYTMIISQ